MEFTKEMHLACLKRDIKQVKETGLLCEVAILGGNRCKEAIEINGTKMSFDEMLKNKPLPYKYCTRDPFCICSYLFHPLRGKDGSLLHRKSKPILYRVFANLIKIIS